MKLNEGDKFLPNWALMQGIKTNVMQQHCTSYCYGSQLPRGVKKKVPALRKNILKAFEKKSLRPGTPKHIEMFLSEIPGLKHYEIADMGTLHVKLWVPEEFIPEVQDQIYHKMPAIIRFDVEILPEAAKSSATA